MMLPTHVLAGMWLGTAAGLVVPEFAGLAIVAGAIGGALPDFDLYAGHRKTLHFPVYFTVLAVPALVLSAFLPTPSTVVLGCLLGGAALHSVSDVVGGGLELRPWEATSERAVYDHYGGRWLAPKRWIRYDGSPGDLLLATTLATPLLLVHDGQIYLTVGGAVAVAVGYSAVRRVLPTIAASLTTALISRAPQRLLDFLPRRYRVDGRDALAPETPD